LRMSFGNLIRNPVNGMGLLGWVNGFTFDPDLEAGMFYGRPDPDATYHNNIPAMEYLPKTFRLNCEFNILHEHSLGFQRASKDSKIFSFRNPKVNDANYPYLASDEEPKYTPPESLQVPNPDPDAGSPAPDTGPQIDFQTGKLIPERNRAEREAHARRSAAVSMLQPTAAEDAAIDGLLNSVQDD